MNLLFDLDGTLADPIDAFATSMDFAFDELKLPRISREVMRTLIGPPLHMELPKLLGETRASLAPEVMRLYREHHGRAGIYSYRFYDGVNATLEELRAQNKIFVATSKPKVYADTILRHFGKAQYFEFVFGSELSGVNAKKGDLIRFAVSEGSLDPLETIMIGDRKHDMIGASENAIPAIGVTWGYGSREELELAGAKAIAATWTDLIRILARPPAEARR